MSVALYSSLGIMPEFASIAASTGVAVIAGLGFEAARIKGNEIAVYAS